jgi:hypothetical protein
MRSEREEGSVSVCAPSTPVFFAGRKPAVALGSSFSRHESSSRGEEEWSGGSGGRGSR